jgi:hypothetical protein
MAKTQHTPGPWHVKRWALSTAVAPVDHGNDDRPLFQAVKPRSYYTDYPVTRIDEDGGEWKTLSNEAARRAGNYVATPEHKAEVERIEAANARLIAAAPDMLEALLNLENDGGANMPPSAWKLVQDAIQKATGNQKDG